MDIVIHNIEPVDQAKGLRLRSTLWSEPHYKISELITEMEEEIITDPEQPVFVAVRPGGIIVKSTAMQKSS